MSESFSKTPLDASKKKIFKDRPLDHHKQVFSGAVCTIGKAGPRQKPEATVL